MTEMGEPGLTRLEHLCYRQRLGHIIMVTRFCLRRIVAVNHQLVQRLTAQEVGGVGWQSAGITQPGEPVTLPVEQIAVRQLRVLLRALPALGASIWVLLALTWLTSAGDFLADR